MNKQNQYLNIAKAVAAFLVVLIHVPFPGLAGNIVTALARTSVPFFFCISGYFFFKEDPQAEVRSIPRKVMRLLKLLLLSELLYFSFYVALQLRHVGFSLSAVTNVLNNELIERYLAHPESYLLVFAPPFNSTFWFVGSLIVIYLLAYPITKLGLQRVCVICSAILMCIGFLISRLQIGGISSNTICQLLPCLPYPFFMIGYYIKKHQGKLSSIRTLHHVVLLIVGILLTVIEQFFGFYILYIGTFVLVFALFSFCTKQQGKPVTSLFGRMLSYIGQHLSSSIYVLHMIIVTVLRVILPHIFPSASPFYLWSLPILTCIATTLCANLVHLLTTKLPSIRCSP